MRKRIVFTILVALLISITSPIFAASPKAGAACSKAGSTATFGGKKFTCIKSGRKLAWDKGVTVSKPTPTPALTPTPVSTPTLKPAPSPTPSPSMSVAPEDLNGKICSTENQVTTNSIGEYLCLKTNDGLRWAKNNPDPNPKPSSSNSPTPIPSPSSSPTQPWVDPLDGKPCSNIYERIPNQIFELICIPYKENHPGSNDATLYWAQNNLPGDFSFPAPKAPILIANSYSEPTVNSAQIDQCKVVETSKTRTVLTTGFPRLNSLTPSSGTLKWALIPVDFADLPGESNFMPRFEEQMKLLSEWYYTVSEGKLKIEWVVAKNWITLPGKSSDYKIPYSDDPSRSAEVNYFWKKAIAESDRSFDFTGIKTVNFILPKSQKIVSESGQGFPWNPELKANPTAEGAMDSFTILGSVFDLPGSTYWSYWAHEFGHAIGIPHIGSSRISSPYQTLDLMGNQEGPARQLSGWLRFVEGWLEDEKVYCQEKNNLKSTEITLVPLDESKLGIKLVVIKLSATKALILESRRFNKFGCITEGYREGVLAYIYDASLGHGEEFLSPLSPDGRALEKAACRSPSTADSLLRTGDKVTVEGVTVEVLLHGVYDSVKIYKKD